MLGFRHQLLYILRDPAWRVSLISFAVFRVLISLWMWLVRKLVPVDLTPHPVLRPYLDVPVETNSLIEVWQRWDALHYQAIAERGYGAYDSAIFTPPLFPLLIRGLNELFNIGTLTGGIIISNIAFLFGLIFWYRLVLLETGNQKVSRYAVVLLTSFPTAFFFLAGYTESLYFLAAVLVFYSIRRENWVSAGIWSLVASLTRLTGMLVLLPIAFTIWEKWRAKNKISAGLVQSAVVGLLGAIAFPLYSWLGLGMSPLSPFLVQAERFAGGVGLPFINVFAAIKQILAGQFVGTNIIDVLLFLPFVVGAIYVWRKLPKIYAVYYFGVLLLYAVRISNLQPLLSIGRYVLALFPLFILLAEKASNPAVLRRYLYPSWMLTLYLSGQFALWGWVG